MAIEVTPVQAKEILASNIKAGLVTMLEGSPSTAKSAITIELAREYNLKLIDVRMAQCEPTDLLGFPYVDAAANKSRYVPMDTFPLATDPLPKDADGNQMDGWLLFLDEFNSADKQVQKAAYKLLQNRMVGNLDLHPRMAIVCAGNLATDGALVEELSSALISRISKVRVRPDHKSFLDFWRRSNYDYRVSSFLEFKPNCMYTHTPDVALTQEPYACYRTWEDTHKILAGNPDVKNPILLPQLAGLLGEGTAREFLAYLHIHTTLPTIAQITANPEKIAVPKEPGVQYALTGAIGQNMDTSNADQLMKFVARLPMEFQVVTLREVTRRDVKMVQEPSIQAWIRTNGKDLH